MLGSNGSVALLEGITVGSAALLFSSFPLLVSFYFLSCVAAIVW